MIEIYVYRKVGWVPSPGFIKDIELRSVFSIRDHAFQDASLGKFTHHHQQVTKLDTRKITT